MRVTLKAPLKSFCVPKERGFLDVVAFETGKYTVPLRIKQSTMTHSESRCSSLPEGCAGDMAQLLECLPSMHRTLGSVSHTM